MSVPDRKTVHVARRLPQSTAHRCNRYRKRLSCIDSCRNSNRRTAARRNACDPIRILDGTIRHGFRLGAGQSLCADGFAICRYRRYRLDWAHRCDGCVHLPGLQA